jgi:rhamnulokinase
VSRYLAVDLGAESGRLIAGSFDGTRIELEEVHRFANRPVRTPDGWHWDLLGVFREVLSGLRMAAGRYGSLIAGIGVDAWGVDYALLDREGRLLGNPYTYRDSRTDGVPDLAARMVSPAEQYGRTGIAQLQINTIYQLMAAARDHDSALAAANTLLMIADLMHYWLTGLRACERTSASTTGALAVEGAWAHDLLARLGLPTGMFVSPVGACSRLGPLLPDLAREVGLSGVPVIVPATHDTACAVAAIPALPGAQDGCVFISCGTWSLIGMELTQPVLSEAARLAGFSNERSAAGTFTLHTNIMGLWFLEQARQAWHRSGDPHGAMSYEELVARAAAIPSPRVVINLEDRIFLHPDDMLGAIRMVLPADEQARVGNPVCLARAILESLALVYRLATERVAALTKSSIRTVHLLGGGARNSLLCQLTADATGCQVLAGPIEASALGNVLLQAVGAGELGSLRQASEVACASAVVRRYVPGDHSLWAERAVRLQTLRQDGATG